MCSLKLFLCVFLLYVYVHVHKEETRIEKVLGNTLITTSAWRNANNAASGGIGILLDKANISSLAEVIKWNRRIIIVHFNGNPKTSIIIHYSPCEGNEEVEDHYANLTSATLSIPKHNFLIVMGDFNAHFGQSSANKYSYHSIINSNGQI